MKKIMAAGLAMLIAAPTVAQAQDRNLFREFRDAQREIRQLRGDDDRARDERREQREERRERRDARREWREDRWDDGRRYSYRHPAPHNYYYYAPPRTYYYGQPSYGYYGQPYGYGYGYGYNSPSYYGHRWMRGQILPPHYRRHVVYDYHRYGWGPPPRGYAYYRTDTGDIILAAIATGLILSILGGGW
jgi:Ni/Co efflux regulator RcnB